MMQTLQARIDSFQKTRRVKRYPNKPSSSTASVKWPHPPDFKANANTLAEAGFFFSPSWDDRDSVTCFLCGKELSDWDANDDPFDIHYAKCQSTCAWAVVRCGLTQDLDNKGHFIFKNKMRLPSGKTMEKARLQTFGKDWWPHDGELGHGATSVKMAQAGFVYTPQAAGDDTVMCFYCNLSLGGWEREDDPVQEHRRRGTACPFLALTEQQSEDELAGVHVADPPPLRPKRGKSRSTTSATSSKPRRKTKATRGKLVKASAPLSRYSPSPSQTVSHEQDPEPVPDPAMDVLLAEDHVSHVVTTPPPLSSESHHDAGTAHKSGSIRSLLDQHTSPSGPSVLSKPCTSPHTPLKDPNPIVSLSPAGRPTVASPQHLTDRERTMSLEQWIQQEIGLSYERLRVDGQSQIELFKAKAAELRICIDEL